MVFNPFGMGSARQGLHNQQAYSGQQAQQPYDFKGLDERLGKLETGIAGLTDQFKNFQTPAQETVQEGYTGAPAPSTEYSGNDAAPPLAPTGSLFDQLSTSYGQPATMQDQFNQDNPNYVSQAVAMGYAEPGTPHYIRGGGDYTQGFQDFVHDQGYYVDPRGSWVDGPMNISETPIDLPTRGIASGMNLPGAFGRPNDLPTPIGGLTQPQQQQALQGGLGALQGPTTRQPVDPNALVAQKTPISGWRPESTITSGNQPLQTQSSLSGLMQQQKGYNV